MTFRLNFCLDLPARREVRFCTERENQKELIGHLDFMEQIKHLLWNWDSWLCILMKIIKGK